MPKSFSIPAKSTVPISTTVYFLKILLDHFSSISNKMPKNIYPNYYFIENENNKKIVIGLLSAGLIIGILMIEAAAIIYYR